MIQPPFNDVLAILEKGLHSSNYVISVEFIQELETSSWTTNKKSLGFLNHF